MSGSRDVSAMSALDLELGVSAFKTVRWEAKKSWGSAEVYHCSVALSADLSALLSKTDRDLSTAAAKKKKKLQLSLIYSLSSSPKTIEVLVLGSDSASAKQLLEQWPAEDAGLYLEWLNEASGSYLYYDLRAAIGTVDSLLIDTSLFAPDCDTLKHAFDESTSLDAALFPTDTVVASLLRSRISASMAVGKVGTERSSISWADTNWTKMGRYNGHWLFLGGTPTLAFVRKQAIGHLFNCRLSANKAHITAAAKSGETLFDVARWAHSAPMAVAYASGYSVETDTGSAVIADTSKDQMRLRVLDSQIDKVHLELAKGNVFIHCLAGAHRSPFVTGCYLLKYGGFHEKSAREVYAHMSSLRSIVQPLSYDKWIDKYARFLKKAKAEATSS